jgi:hypothetical protein
MKQTFLVLILLMVFNTGFSQTGNKPNDLTRATIKGD